MSPAATFFRKDDVIIWNPDHIGKTPWLQQELGNGPFTVIEPIDVPNECQFPDTHCSNGEHPPHCPVKSSQSVGHPQWVTIRQPNGHVSQGTIHHDNAQYSGWWFIHA